MAFGSIAPLRLGLAGLAVAGALAGTAGAAVAQYYVYETYEDVRPYRGGYGYGYDYDDGYRDVYRARSAPPRNIARTAARDFGLVRIDRTVRAGASNVIDGRSVDGSRVRLIFDARTGALRDRILLQAAPRQPAPRVARVAPDDDRPAAPRLTPRPPERPAALKPPAQATAPATVIPPAPAAPAAPSPAPTTPAGVPKPQLVNPNDVRDLAEPERKPPLAQADPSGITVAPVQLPPVQIEDIAPPTPRTETPSVPVTPLD